MSRTANKMEEVRLTVTVEQAARILGISRGLAYQMAREGRIPTLQFGKRIVVPKKAIERLLEQPGVVNSDYSRSKKCNPRRGWKNIEQRLSKWTGLEMHFQGRGIAITINIIISITTGRIIWVENPQL